MGRLQWFRGIIRSCEFATNKKIYKFSPRITLESNCNSIFRYNTFVNCLSSGPFPTVDIIMNMESDHEGSEDATVVEHQCKRERESEAISNASPPYKKRGRNGEGKVCETSIYSSTEQKQDDGNDCDKLETSISELSEEEIQKPANDCGHLSPTVRADSIVSLADSIQSSENSISGDILLEREREFSEATVGCGSVSDDNKDKVALEIASGSTCTPKEKKRTRKRKKESRKSDRQDSGENEPVANIRPNYFVGVQICCDEIHKSIVKVQEDLVAFDPALSKTLVDVATAHLTLLIARIDDEDALSLACSSLDEYDKDLGSQFKTDPIRLTFSGLDHFSNNVLYSRLVEDEHYQRLLNVAENVRQCFINNGVCLPNMKPLNPHLTVAKMSKSPRGKGKAGPRKIEPLSYTNNRELHFGSQVIKSLQLLSMNLPKDERRYYHCSKEVFFVKDEMESGDHTKCCFPRRPIMSAPPRRLFSTAATDDDDDDDPSNILAPSVGVITAVAAALMVVYAVGKVTGKL